VERYEESAMRKIRRRILPFLSTIYFIAFLDRANVAYAKLTMAQDLGFSEWVYGFGAGLFFVGYLLLEIPGALIVQRWGLRRWTARILLTWGLCAISLSLVHTASSFYIGRFVLGVAEGGLFPGIIVYLSRWIPSRHRAKAIASFVLASPVALAIGGPLAGLLLSIRWLGVPGWRWLLIVEGIPALIFAVLTWFALPDLPADASWLSEGERTWLMDCLRAEHKANPESTTAQIVQVFRLPIVIVLCAIIFLANIGIQGFFLWLPTTVQRASGLSAPAAAVVSGSPFVVATISVLVCSWSSDRSGRRALHIYAPLMLSGIIFSVTALTSLSFGWLLFWLCASSAAIYGFGPSFYLLPSLILREPAAAAAIGLINMFAALGGFVGPTVIGKMFQMGYSFPRVIEFLSSCFFFAGALCFCVRRRLRDPLTQETPLKPISPLEGLGL
jgi:ACS family tartrate transporter-like MFS transporter